MLAKAVLKPNQPDEDDKPITRCGDKDARVNFLEQNAAKAMKDWNDMGITEDMKDVEATETAESVEELHQRIDSLEAECAAMRPILLRVAEARMCRDAVTMIESCPHCSLKRGGEYGYAGKHDEKCIVAQARNLGF